MKNLFTFLIICFCIPAMGQLNIGFRTGISFPNLVGNNEQSKGYTSRQGTYGSVFITLQVMHKFDLQPEISYSPQGGKRNGMQQVSSNLISGITLPPGANLYANFNNETILNYLEIPIMARLSIGNKLKYYGCLGPHIAFLVQAKSITSGSSLLYLDAAGTNPLTENGTPLPPVSFNNNTSIKESIKKVAAGMQGGLGLGYMLGRGNIFIEGRTILGLTNIQTHPDTDGKNQTGSLVFAAGYMIKIK